MPVGLLFRNPFGNRGAQTSFPKKMGGEVAREPGVWKAILPLIVDSGLANCYVPVRIVRNTVLWEITWPVVIGWQY